jgi:lipopolysaccharide export system permease protein
VAAVTRIAGFGVQAVADDNVWFNALQYAVPVAAVWWGLSQVFRRPPRTVRAPRLALATAGAA